MFHKWYLSQISRTNHAIICLYYYPQKVCNFHMQVFQIKLKYHCSKPIKLQKFPMQQYNTLLIGQLFVIQKMKIPVTCQFHWPSSLSLFLVLFLGYNAHKCTSCDFIAKFYKFYAPKGNFKQFFFFSITVFAISTFRLFINENSLLFKKCKFTVQCICYYGSQVVKFEPAAILMWRFFELVTILTGFPCS